MFQSIKGHACITFLPQLVILAKVIERSFTLYQMMFSCPTYSLLVVCHIKSVNDPKLCLVCKFHVQYRSFIAMFIFVMPTSRLDEKKIPLASNQKV